MTSKTIHRPLDFFDACLRESIAENHEDIVLGVAELSVAGHLCGVLERRLREQKRSLGGVHGVQANIDFNFWGHEHKEAPNVHDQLNALVKEAHEKNEPDISVPEIFMKLWPQDGKQETKYRPDVIVHVRGKERENNIIVVELKILRKGHAGGALPYKQDKAYDHYKLLECKESLGYQHAIFVELNIQNDDTLSKPLWTELNHV